MVQRRCHPLDEHAGAVLAHMPAHVRRPALPASGLDLLCVLVLLPVLWREQDAAGLPDSLLSCPAEHGLCSRIPVGNPVLRIGSEDGVVACVLDDEAEALLARAQGTHLLQAVDHGT